MKIEKVVNTQQILDVESLGKEIWTAHYTPIIGTAQVDYMLDKFQSYKAISSQLEEGYNYYLLRNDIEIFGYLSLQKREDSLFLSKFYIHEKARGIGFGKQAMSFIYDTAKTSNCNSITLTVNKYNANSIEAYKRMGFTIEEAVVFDIGEGYIMDDYKMEKKLTLL